MAHYEIIITVIVLQKDTSTTIVNGTGLFVASFITALVAILGLYVMLFDNQGSLVLVLVTAFLVVFFGTTSYAIATRIPFVWLRLASESTCIYRYKLGIIGRPYIQRFTLEEASAIKVVIKPYRTQVNLYDTHSLVRTRYVSFAAYLIVGGHERLISSKNTSYAVYKLMEGDVFLRKINSLAERYGLEAIIDEQAWHH